jgi:putative hydrolase of the HAD superfamily
MRAHIPAIRPFPEVAPALAHAAKFASLALITEGRSVTQRQKICALDLESFFEQIIITAELGDGVTKTSGFPYQRLRSMFGHGRRFVMIGDSEHKDSIPARAAGFEAAIVRRPRTVYVHPAPREPAHATIWDALAALGVCDPPRPVATLPGGER